MTIRTYKNVPFDPADYPALKHFWRMENAGTLVCAVTGARWTPPVSQYDSSLNACLIGDDAANKPKDRPYPTPLDSGSLYQIKATDSIILIGVGRTGQATGVTDPDDNRDTGYGSSLLRVAMGDFNGLYSSNNHAIGASNVGNCHPGYIGENSGYVNDYINFPDVYDDEPNGGVDVALYLTAERDGNITCDVEKLDGTLPLDPRYSASFLNFSGEEIGACNMGPYMHANGAWFYGIALFAFEDGLPTDKDTAIEWMANHWATAEPINRSPYVAWRGLS